MRSLSLTQKTNISVALNKYIDKKICSQQKIADDCGFNEAYITQIKKGEYRVGKSPIKDEQFSLVANYIGLKLKKEYWQKVLTKENIMIEDALNDAKEYATIKTVIANTGAGKTFTVDDFMSTNKENCVFHITVGQLHKVKNVIDDILFEMKIKPKGDPLNRLRQITKYVTSLYHQGKHPLIIIDEAENLKLPVLGFTKQIYDAIVKPEICGVVLIGTDQLLASIKKMEDSNKLGIPQFARRIRAGIVDVEKVRGKWHEDNNFLEYVTGLVWDVQIVTLLKEQARNYGEVHDFVVAAMRDADRCGEEFNYEFFIDKYNL